MRSILKRLIALSLLALVAPFRAGALGLGDIKLNSYLNQPLSAEITVLPGNTASLDQVRVKLAPQAAFEQAGIERLPVLDHIKFQLVKGKDGKPRIKLSSDEPIKEPFLDFILQFTWSNGRISREYTVLLDPPTTTAEHAPPVEAATTAAAQGQSAAAQTAAQPQSGATVPSTARGAAQSGAVSPSPGAKLTKDFYGRTQRDDTLWSIAKTVRPDDSVSVQQVMLALVKKNPEAFYKGNVNTLKAGYVLRLPNKELINQVGEASAIHEVQLQYHQWQQIKQGSLLADATDASPAGTKQGGPGKGAQGDQAPASKAAAKPGAASADQAKSAADEARLTLLPPSADKAGAGGAATVSATEQGQAAAGTGALKQQLNSLQQTQEKQINDLRSQVDELNQQVTSMQRLLSLKDDTLSTLQQKLGTLQGGPAAAQVTPKPSAASEAGAKPQVNQAAQPKPKAATPPAPAPHKKAATPPAHVHSDSGLLADPKVLGMGGVVVLLLSALSWLSVRRRRMKAESVSPEEAGVDDAAAEAPEAEGNQQYMPTGGDLLEAEINEIDPLAEADVYMAYRRYQQAEDLLRGAIQQEPHRHELQLKLAEVFAAAGNAPAFVAEAQNLHNELGGEASPIWSKMVEMGREIQPDHPLFMEDAGGQAVADHGAAAGDTHEAAMPPVVDPVAADPVADEQRPLPGNGVEQTMTLGDAPVTDGTQETGEVPPLEAPTGLEAGLAADSPGAGAEQPSADKDNSIEFESGLGQPRAAAPDDSIEAAVEAGSPQGNEIDFEMPLGEGVTEQDPPSEPVAGLPGADPLAEDALAAQDSIPALDAGDKGAGDGPTLSGTGLEATVDDGDTPPLMEPQGGAPVPEEHAGAAQAPQAKETPAHELDFDIDFDKIAGRDQDFDNFFEELESVDAGDDDADAEAGHQDVGTKLDLAKAFMEMGDQEGAKEILQEVVDLGNEDQKQEAQGLLQQLQV